MVDVVVVVVVVVEVEVVVVVVVVVVGVGLGAIVVCIVVPIILISVKKKNVLCHFLHYFRGYKEHKFYFHKLYFCVMSYSHCLVDTKATHAYC